MQIQSDVVVVGVQRCSCKRFAVTCALGSLTKQMVSGVGTGGCSGASKSYGPSCHKLANSFGHAWICHMPLKEGVPFLRHNMT